MKNTSHILAKSIALLIGIAALQPAFATTPVLSDDTTINRSLPRASYFTHPTLGVAATAQGVGKMAFVKFDISNFPVGTGVTVSNATLRVYCSSIKRPGSVQAVPVLSPWMENEITGINAPATGSTTQPGTPLTLNGDLIGTYAVETAPAGIVFDGRAIWVTNSGSNTITQLDSMTGQLIDTSPVGNSPLGLCFDGTAVWVANKTSNNLLRRQLTAGNFSQPTAMRRGFGRGTPYV